MSRQEQSTYNPYNMSHDNYHNGAYSAQHSPYYHHSPQPDIDHYSPTAHSNPYPMMHKDPSYASELSESASTARESNMPLSVPLPEDDSPGFWRSILPDSIACRFYLLVVLVETIVDIAIEADILFLLEHNTQATDAEDRDLKSARLPTYLVVFGLAHLFQLLLALDAVHARNTLQFIFLTIFNFLLLIYAIIQKSEILDVIPDGEKGISHIPVTVLTIIVAVVIAVAEVAYIALGWKIYTEFGWQVYKRLGADRSVKNMYMHFQIFICLIKFDVFFWLGFSVQWIFLVLKKDTTPFEYYVTIAALPFSMVLLICGHLAAKHERKWAMGVFMAGCGAAFVYFAYKLYKILRFRNDENLAPVFKTLTVFSALAVVLIVITFIWAVIVSRNFGRGLKTKVSASSHQKGASSVHLGRSKSKHTLRSSHFELGSTRPHRLSID